MMSLNLILKVGSPSLMVLSFPSLLTVEVLKPLDLLCVSLPMFSQFSNLLLVGVIRGFHSSMFIFEFRKINLQLSVTIPLSVNLLKQHSILLVFVVDKSPQLLNFSLHGSDLLKVLVDMHAVLVLRLGLLVLSLVVAELELVDAVSEVLEVTLSALEVLVLALEVTGGLVVGGGFAGLVEVLVRLAVAAGG